MQSVVETGLMLVILILSVIAHEVAHGFAAYALGDPTAKHAGRLSLNPLLHIDTMGSIIVPALLVLSGAGLLFGWAKPVPYNPHNLKNKRFGEAIVAVAGSATNIALAIIFALIARAAFSFSLPAAASLASTICFVNLYLGFFNLIPLPPLDGYTVVRGVLPFRYSYRLRDFESSVRTLGAGGIVIVLAIFSFVFAGPFFHFIARIGNLLLGIS